MALDYDEERGASGPCIGCCRGCFAFWCCCRGCVAAFAHDEDVSRAALGSSVALEGGSGTSGGKYRPRPNVRVAPQLQHPKRENIASGHPQYLVSTRHTDRACSLADVAAHMV